MLEKSRGKMNIFRTPAHSEWSYTVIVVLFGKIIR